MCLCACACALIASVIDDICQICWMTFLTCDSVLHLCGLGYGSHNFHDSFLLKMVPVVLWNFVGCQIVSTELLGKKVDN